MTGASSLPILMNRTYATQLATIDVPPASHCKPSSQLSFMSVPVVQPELWSAARESTKWAGGHGALFPVLQLFLTVCIPARPQKSAKQVSDSHLRIGESYCTSLIAALPFKCFLSSSAFPKSRTVVQDGALKKEQFYYKSHRVSCQRGSCP